MEFFTSTDVTTGQKLLEILFIFIGLLLINTGVRNFLDEENPNKLGTGIFWGVLGIIVAFGRWIPPVVVGGLVILTAIPPILNKVSPGKKEDVPEEYSEAMSEKIGYKIFVPAIIIGLTALGFALLTELGALVGVGVGVILSALILKALNGQNKVSTFLQDNKRLLDQVGPLCMMPMFLASLGAVFTAAGVGEVVAEIVGKVIPQGNVTLGIIVFALGMALFTMIMGNAFAAITVMTVGIGAPFVLAYGADPVVIGSLALTCGYCGTLVTPMAANFNIVPVAVLEMNDDYGVIKNQVLPAILILIFQIIYMILFS